MRDTRKLQEINLPYVISDPHSSAGNQNMPGKKNVFAGVGEDITPTEDSMVWANLEVPGTGAHVSGALERCGWDGKDPVATILITAEGGAIKGSQWMLRGSLGKIRLPMTRVQLDPGDVDQKLWQSSLT